jgi:predicted membrane metal-binding protein
MIVWSGRGIFSILVLIVTFVLCAIIFPNDKMDYGIVTSLFVTAIFSWVFGKKWNNLLFIDEETGQKIIIKSNHGIFWIKMQYWGIIFGIIGIIILAQNSILYAILVSIIMLAFIIYTYIVKQKSADNQDIERETISIVEKQETPELETEDLKRRQEKEDPTRFMPH